VQIYVVRMLQRAELAPLDLVRAWDRTGDGCFSRREWLCMMKRLTFLGYAEAVRREAGARGSSWKAAAASSSPPLESAEPGGASALVAAARQAAVTKLQAHVRGRRLRQTMRSSEGDALWYETIKPVVFEAFDAVSSGDGRMDVQELVRWLNAEWRRQRLLTQQGATDEHVLLLATGPAAAKAELAAAQAPVSNKELLSRTPPTNDYRRVGCHDDDPSADGPVILKPPSKPVLELGEVGDDNGDGLTTTGGFDPNAFYSSALCQLVRGASQRKPLKPDDVERALRSSLVQKTVSRPRQRRLSDGRNASLTMPPRPSTAPGASSERGSASMRSPHRRAPRSSLDSPLSPTRSTRRPLWVPHAPHGSGILTGLGSRLGARACVLGPCLGPEQDARLSPRFEALRDSVAGLEGSVERVQVQFGHLRDAMGERPTLPLG